MTAADLVTVLAVVAVIAAVWYVLGRIEAHLLRTGARHPAQDETRLLPIYYLTPGPREVTDEEFVAGLPDEVRGYLLDVAREVDTGAPIPDGFIELRQGGAR